MDIDFEKDFLSQSHFMSQCIYDMQKEQVDVSIEARCIWSGLTLLEEEVFETLCALGEHSEGFLPRNTTIYNF